MQELEKILEEIENMEYPAEGIGCGLEDVSITDRYESAEYGWNEAVERITEIIRNHMNDGWIPVNDRLPEERINPVSQDFYEYQVMAKFGNVKDVRHYKYGNGHWWHGPGIVDKYVIAWRPLPKPYRPERSDNNDGE